MFKKIAIIALSVVTTACATADNSVRLGMKFNQPYHFIYGGGSHAGLDIDVPLGTPVRSIADGVVDFQNTFNIRGNLTNIVEIKHEDGIRSTYLHIDKVTVKVGDKIKQGEQFAVTALNGPGGPNTSARVPYPHLHLEITKDFKKIDPESLKMQCRNSTYIWPVGC